MQLTVSGCPGIESEALDAIVAITQPVGTNRGTIVHFSGGGGQGFEFDIGDIFENFGFGGGRKQETRGRDISIDINLTFSESIFGVTRKVLLTKNNICKECTGTGGKKQE